MPEERLRSITSASHLAPDDVARHTFASVRRGFDPDEVRAYLESVANGLRTIGERERELLDQLSDAEHRAANPVLDEHTLTTALGTETARVLHSAHEVAAEMVGKAEAEAARLLNEAREEVERSTRTTEGRLAERTAEVEAAAADLKERTNQQIASGLDAARREADQLVAEAREECRAMVDEAQGLRARVLSDMAKRRKVLHAQIEQLRAGRERLAETVQEVRRSIDVIADDLFAAEDQARLAAEAAGREAIAQPDEGSPEELASSLLAEESAAGGAEGPVPEVGDVSGDETEPGAGDLFDVEQMEADDAAATAAVIAVATADGGPDDTGPDDTAPVAVDPDPAPVGDDPAAAGASAGQATDDEPGAGPDEPAAPVPEEKVDALFAKLRAASGGAEPPATQVGATTDAADPVEDDEADEPPEARNPLAVQRDELIAPVVKALSRRLKRTLQDNQNELLDQLRSKGTHWSLDLLPDVTEHIDSYATAMLPGLEQAAEAGASFAGSGGGGPSVDALLGVAHQLAESVVDPIRRRLAEDEGLDGAEESVVADHVGSAFREWKGERIERLAGDHVVAAFSLGTIAAVDKEPSAQVEWLAVPGTGDAPCPDCEDNGLNGSLTPGEEFPTGHRHPPAHPGCRCVLVIPAT
jgi:DivIVA domain-containing protein